jgi:OmcA/MtrC family decaheme c-type cytochrome
VGTALAAACDEPRVGQSTSTNVTTVDARIELTSVGVNASDQVVVGFTLVKDGQGVDAATAATLLPRFTLAALGTDPVSGIGAWRSLLLTGSQTLAQLPIGGPGTPPANVLTDVKQPGSESTGTLTALGAGAFRYVFANPLSPGYDPGETHRVGVYLAGTPGTHDTSDTIDFVPSGAAPAPRDTVLDDRCNACHGSVHAHGGYRNGVRLCLTCHTYQNADPDTVDPAALDGATGATDPNPLDLGRMVHRIHRGKYLPTLYRSTSTAAAPALPSATALPLPFSPITAGRNAPVLGRKYSIVGYQSREFVYGRVEARTDNGQPARTMAAGVLFPRDLRDCEACHQGAPQESEVVNAISRRTCAGCHPDVWFGAGAITDTVHFAHPGGPQADDTQCAGCHVAATPTQPKLYAPIAEMHVVPRLSPRYNGLTAQIVSVTNMLPGQRPTVVFTLADRDGAPSPLNAPTPPDDAQSPVPRAMERVALTFAGPAERDFVTSNTVVTLPTVPPTTVLNSPFTDTVLTTATADVSGQFTHTFSAALPADATGTWAVGLEARRRNTTVPCTTHYDTATDTFPWPGTGECLYETAENPVVYVDVGVGTWTAGTPSPRRTIVADDRCNACHGLLEFHGKLRNQTEYCLLCHVPDRTDWERRAKLNGNTNLAGNFDGLEERSIHLKTLVHRIHTGGRVGAAALDLIQPFIVYGYLGTPYFFDEGIFPNDLKNCSLCHEDGTYLVASVPAGAPGTVANENPSIMHAGTVAHTANESATPPIQAACMGCHATGSTLLHAQRNTVNGVERCANCHTRGSTGVETAHGLTP